ncbi:MAG: hypothetical protein ABSE79_18055 [Terriglobia bacterium]|jgi:hypothetical protein
MKHLALATLVVLIFGGTLLAQEIPEPHDRTSAPPNARFEIVQSQIAARWTFRLDRFTGRVAQLSVDAADDSVVSWWDTPVVGLPQLENPTRARFQLFTSGIAAKHTFLIDTDTGKTWLMVNEHAKRANGTEYEHIAWVPFTE